MRRAHWSFPPRPARRRASICALRFDPLFAARSAATSPCGSRPSCTSRWTTAFDTERSVVRSVRQHGRHVDGVVQRVDPGRRLAARPGRWRSCARATSRCVGLGAVRSRCARTIAPSAAVISRALVTSNGKTYVVKISCARPVRLPLPLSRWSPAPREPIAACADADDEQHGERRYRRGRPQPLAPDGLHQRIGRVDADQHEHEEEQHHDRAGVDDDLHEGEERRALHGVHDRQREHHDREQQRAVHGLPHEDHAERGGDREDREDPEHGLAVERVQVGTARPPPCRETTASSFASWRSSVSRLAVRPPGTNLAPAPPSR